MKKWFGTLFSVLTAGITLGTILWSIYVGKEYIALWLEAIQNNKYCWAGIGLSLVLLAMTLIYIIYWGWRSDKRRAKFYKWRLNEEKEIAELKNKAKDEIEKERESLRGIKKTREESDKIWDCFPNGEFWYGDMTIEEEKRYEVVFDLPAKEDFWWDNAKSYIHTILCSNRECKNYKTPLQIQQNSSRLFCVQCKREYTKQDIMTFRDNAQQRFSFEINKYLNQIRKSPQCTKQ